MAPPRPRQRQLADRALACGWQPARRARRACLDLLWGSRHALLATLIRKVLACALVVSAAAVAAYPLLQRYAMRSADTSVAPDGAARARRSCSGSCSACSWR